MNAGQQAVFDRVPELPVDEVRAAIVAEEWDEAGRLLAVHQSAIVGALAKVDLKTCARQPWLDLLEDHKQLMDELRVARDAVAAAIVQLGTNRRGIRAWQRELA